MNFQRTPTINSPIVGARTTSKIQREINAIDKKLGLFGIRRLRFSKVVFIPLSDNQFRELIAERERLIKKQGKYVWNPNKHIKTTDHKGNTVWERQGPYIRAIHGQWKDIKNAA